MTLIIKKKAVICHNCVSHQSAYSPHWKKKACHNSSFVIRMPVTFYEEGGNPHSRTHADWQNKTEHWWSEHNISLVSSLLHCLYILSNHNHSVYISKKLRLIKMEIPSRYGKYWKIIRDINQCVPLVQSLIILLVCYKSISNPTKCIAMEVCFFLNNIASVLHVHSHFSFRSRGP